jgi:hypothetical protein
VNRTKSIAPAALVALREALSLVYWYKSDLRSFLMSAIENPQLLSRVNWDDYKRNIVRTLVDFLARDQAQYQDDLLRLMVEVSRMDDFSHLARLEDGKEKAERAREAVESLRQLVTPHADLLREQERAEEARRRAYEASLQKQGVRERLEALCKKFYELINVENHQKRGYLLQDILKELFALFDLDPKASFAIRGEQIDGAFTFANTDYLLEARWQQERVEPKELDVFSGKIVRKLENTLGLFLAINGFSEAGVDAHSTVRPVMILMDGSDLMAVLEGRIDLLELLLRKRRHAAETGRVFLPIHQVLS